MCHVTSRTLAAGSCIRNVCVMDGAIGRMWAKPQRVEVSAYEDVRNVAGV